ncbi:unnamed protein product [Spirodela intermedia]|uniref:Uncharacterized protein n=1 Tax=Spirodela intermedia TaxID=51605 RepID=A0A7I8KJR3_SPIIN|nr:unnamed protein product [Spirodela intermedia]
MACCHRGPGVLLAFLLFLLPPPPPAVAAAPWLGALGRWRTVVSLSHSLLQRVANLRTERGDHTGAARARAIAHRLELLGGGGGGAEGGLWSLCWDYLRNYAWREGGGIGGVEATAEIYRAAGELVSSLQELGPLRSDAERAQWAARNYPKMVSAAGTIFRRLSQAFWRSGALRETVLLLQKEVADGDLVRDCLRVGAQDLEGLILIARDLFFSSSTGSSVPPDSDYDL